MISGIAYAANAALNLLLALLLAHTLPPDAYGVVAVHLSAALLCAAAVFDWTRDAALRFYTPLSRDADPAIRATLDSSLVLLLFGTVAIAVAVPSFLMRVHVAVVVFVAASYALVEYVSVIARCLHKNRTYCALIVVRHAFTYGGALQVARMTQGGEITLLALGAAAWPAIILGAVLLWDSRARPWLMRGQMIRTLAGYALPLTGAEALFQLLSFAARSRVAIDESFGAAGAYALSFDIAFKVSVVVAAAADAALLPRLVAAHEADGGESRRRLGRHVATMTLIVAPFIAGSVITGPLFATVALPAGLHHDFLKVFPFAALASFLYTALGLILRSCFQIAKQTLTVLLGSGVAAATTLALLAHTGSVSPVEAALAQVIGLAAAFVILTARAIHGRLLSFPARDFAKISLSVLLMAVACLLTSRLNGPPMMVLAATISVGACTYAAAALGLDIAGARFTLRELCRR